jgi:predicted DNA-binding protein
MIPMAMPASLDGPQRIRGLWQSSALDTGQPHLYAWSMEVPLNSDLQARLAHLASQQGRDPEALAREAIERLVDYDEWFIHPRSGERLGPDRRGQSADA